MKIEETSFQNSKGQMLAARIYYGDEKSKKCVIFSHGLFSSKDSFKVQNLSNDITQAGFTFFTFDFSFAGESEDTFENLSLLQEVDDLSHAVKFCKSKGMESLHIIGSSMGGVVSVLYSGEASAEIDSLIVIATPSDLQNILKRIAGLEDVQSLPENGMTDISGIFINNSFFKEALDLDLKGAIKKIKVPILILHGTKDELIPLESSDELYNLVSSEKKKFLIEGGDHSLTRDSDISLIRENILNWLKERG